MDDDYELYIYVHSLNFSSGMHACHLIAWYIKCCQTATKFGVTLHNLGWKICVMDLFREQNIEATLCCYHYYL